MAGYRVPVPWKTTTIHKITAQIPFGPTIVVRSGRSMAVCCADWLIRPVPLALIAVVFFGIDQLKRDHRACGKVDDAIGNHGFAFTRLVDWKGGDFKAIVGASLRHQQPNLSDVGVHHDLHLELGLSAGG